MALRNFKNDWPFARCFVRTSLSTEMMVTLLGIAATHQANNLREPIDIPVKLR